MGRRGGFRARRRFRGRGFRRFVRAKRTINHFENDITAVVSGTETLTTIATGVDDTSNRSTHIPDGARLVFLSVRGECTTIPAATTKFTHCLIHRAGGLTISATPIASYFSTTDPLPGDAIMARKQMLAGPRVDTKAASDFTRHTFLLRWKGNILVRDGDDFIWDVLQNSGGNLNFNARVTLVYRR